MLKENKVYKKKNSFVKFSNDFDQNYYKTNLILRLEQASKKKINLPEEYIDLYSKIENIILSKSQNDNHEPFFSITPNVNAEIDTVSDEDLPRYLVHRYRYEVYPEIKKLDKYPPYLQIEPSSICNFRCVFCFETDKTFTDKKNGHMGTMSLDLFKKVIDSAHKKVEFISIASRGEPLVCKDIDKMLEYTENKFLNLKINTNASLLNEKKIHSVLSGGVKTIVFSVDAADPKLYEKLRVNGKFEKTLSNIEMFNRIKNKHYKNSKIITRVSGVKFNNEQNFVKFENFWKGIVDQVIQ